jgi:hypothetical protein
MPRSAATIFGIALVAASIGFNTWRYPSVWRLVGTPATSATNTELLQKATSAPAAQPAKVSPVDPASAAAAPTLATKSEVSPVAIAAVAASAAPVEVGPPIKAEAVAAERRLPVSTVQEKALVPVPKLVSLEKKSTGVGEVAGLVRRLPTVDLSVPSPAVRYASESSGGAIPIYPSTGIQ